jgi:hypothetical protein
MGLSSLTSKIWPKSSAAAPADPLTELREIVGTGLTYEDQFITIYLSVLRDEGYLGYFGENLEAAKKILTVLIEESTVHQAMLEGIMTKIS